MYTHHSLSCVPLRQYRACVVDSLGLGITCVLYHSTLCRRHPDLVSFAFYVIPIFHYNLINLLVINLFKKGDREDPSNYRGITLLSVVGKVFVKVHCLDKGEALHEGLTEAAWMFTL